MKKLKKKRGLKTYQSGGTRDATAVNTPLLSPSNPNVPTNPFKKYPYTPSPREAYNTFNQKVLTPAINLFQGSIIPGENPALPELLAGKEAQMYLNNQRFKGAAGNRIGTKGEIESANFAKSQDDKYWQKYLTSRDMMGQTNWYSGATDIPGVKRAGQMSINKAYRPGPIDTRGVINRYPTDEPSGIVSQAADPGNYKNSWDWDVSPYEINKAKGEPRIEYPIDYHQKNQMGGVSRTGYRSNSPDRFNDFNIIPSGSISMHQVNHPVLGIDNRGNRKLMQPGASYQFPGTSVTEYPMAGKMAVNKGMMQSGGPIITNDPNDPRLKALPGRFYKGNDVQEGEYDGEDIGHHHIKWLQDNGYDVEIL